MRRHSFGLFLLPLLGLLFAAPCRADDPEALSKAHDELQAALNPGGPVPSDPDRIAHLKAALADLNHLPHTRYDRRGRHRADTYIHSAIDKIEHGGSPNQISGDIRDADLVVENMGS